MISPEELRARRGAGEVSVGLPDVLRAMGSRELASPGAILAWAAEVYGVEVLEVRLIGPVILLARAEGEDDVAGVARRLVAEWRLAITGADTWVDAVDVAVGDMSDRGGGGR